MTTFRGDRVAHGAPGIAPRWTNGNKEGVGTAYAASSRLWFTLWNGIVTEVYYPTVDRPQTRDLQFLVSDGAGTFLHEEKRHLRTETCGMDPALGYEVSGTPPSDGPGYALSKQIIADPHLPCLLVRARLSSSDPDLLAAMRLYVLCAPHLEVGGAGNSGHVIETAGHQLLVAEKNGTWLALGATVPLLRASCGYVGASDGWTDLTQNNGRLAWEFDRAPDGNIALTGELDLSAADEDEQNQTRGRAFTLGLAFGDGPHSAVTTLLQALGVPFAAQRERFEAQWTRPARHRLPLEDAAGDGGRLFLSSYNLLLAHEDKTYQGALVASLSIPWGEARSDEDRGGYHLVWPRDMVHSALALLSAGNEDTPLRALIYLAASQRPDGGFAQNFWIGGEPYWGGVQLDQTAFPVLLAHRLKTVGALKDFDPYPLVLRAAAYLVHHGPVTEQERWEEAGGYSPSTLAVVVAALVCAGGFADDKNDAPTAEFLRDYADWLERHIENWTVTNRGTLHPDVARHYVRITPARPGEPPTTTNGPDEGRTVFIANRAPGETRELFANEVIDAGFLELVRWGVRSPDDPLIRASLDVADRVLRRDTPRGPAWRRYNHDGYGQRANGDPYADGWGQGRAWPLLAGERAHYELAAGNGEAARALRDALEAFAGPAGLLPEQVWDAESDLPERHLWRGAPTGAARPLAWAYAEYISLLRSLHDGRVVDCLPEVASRYAANRRSSHSGVAPKNGRAIAPEPPRRELWSHVHPTPTAPAGSVLRVLAPRPFRLHWTRDDWETYQDTPALALPALRAHHVDLPTPPTPPGEPIRFTFFWTDRDEWDGRDQSVAIV